MLDIANDIESLTNFKRRTADFLKKMKKTGRPVVLTVNGQAKVVVQDAEAYQRLLELAERAEAIAGIRRGLESLRRGKVRPAREALEELRKKYAVPR